MNRSIFTEKSQKYIRIDLIKRKWGVNMNPSILVVDDEVHMLDLLTMTLEEDFTITTAFNGEEALYLLKEHTFDLCLLDIMMPIVDGWSVLRQMREEKIEVPVIFLSARGEVQDRVEGLQLGADDYITKPFEPAEVLARVHSVIRRIIKQRDKDRFAFHGIQIDLARREVWFEQQEIKLTPTEFDLLITLAQYPNKAFSREHLLDRIWGFDFCGGARTIDTHVKNLRIKLRQVGFEEDLIQTVRGYGYKWGEG